MLWDKFQLAISIRLWYRKRVTRLPEVPFLKYMYMNWKNKSKIKGKGDRNIPIHGTKLAKKC
jgi:hypothetical protein